MNIDIEQHGIKVSLQVPEPVAQDGQVHVSCVECCHATRLNMGAHLLQTHVTYWPLACVGCFNETRSEHKNWAAIHTSCEGCANEYDDEKMTDGHPCRGCFDYDAAKTLRKNYTPQTPKVEEAVLISKDTIIKLKTNGWDKIFKLCCDLGVEKTHGDDILAFIRDLHKRSKTEYARGIQDAAEWLEHIFVMSDDNVKHGMYWKPDCPQMFAKGMRESLLNDPKDGIKAVTERTGRKAGK